MSQPLGNDCFALPQGVNWTPVRTALDHLRSRLSCVVTAEPVAIACARGRILASDVIALRDHPPYPNSAIDGYGFAHGADGMGGLRLVEGRAAAGAPFEGSVPHGSALRILTGAMPPSGVDTVVLQEDVTLKDDRLLFDVDLKRGANIRAAGEDVRVGQTVLCAGRRLTSADIGMLATVGVAEVSVQRRLRVGVLSTGSELARGAKAEPHEIFDANRPMLMALAEGWGAEIIDLGQSPDDRGEICAALDRGAQEADVILTSGGASAGDEDHISAALKEARTLETWRIAVKPGRPLALGFWDQTPVFGFPGNPVAAFVCALIFLRPSFLVMSGADWSEPVGHTLAAKFAKNKKRGRMEFLRARRDGDAVEVFASEGSGRISGLSWADGLVALDHDAGPVKPGDPVRYLPFSDFGL